MQQTFMLHYRIHCFLLTELTVSKACQIYVFQLSIERAAMKAQHFANIWEAALAPFAPPLTTPLLSYAQAYVFKTFHIVFSILTSLSHENTIETSLKSKKFHVEQICKVDA